MDIEFVSVAGGSFRMGSDLACIEALQRCFGDAFARFRPAEVRSWLLKQTPAFETSVATFEMSRGLVTRGQFGIFERVTADSPSALSEGDSDLPVEGLSYLQACAFCRWLSDTRAELIRLPTEAEWEFAASSRGRFQFPWGDTWDVRRANTAEAGPGRASTTGAFTLGRSLQDIEDLAGNLEEWTSTPYRPYSGGSLIRDHIYHEQGPDYRVLRGGSYALNGDLCHAARRHGYTKGRAITGLRIVRAPVRAAAEPDLPSTIQESTP